ncbi:MAG: small subunit ribosomal protein S9 [Parcubacteria group bacterium Greene0416_79]|nr:MAG: small subunit ribosomal protein S9 [Parcubacteria group bacterium Greene0416_79]
MEKDEKKVYIEAVGRRKTAVARVRLYPEAKASFLANGKNLEEYFKTQEQRRVALEALAKSKLVARFKVTALIRGGGLASQAEALRHGVARALVLHTPDLRKKLKKAGFLKRDARAKERRKFGLKKARKSPQWSKR